MAKFTIEQADGVLEIEGGPSPVKLDVFKAWNTYANLHNKLLNDTVELGNQWVQYLVSEGVPALPHGEAFRLADMLAAEKESLKKKFASAQTSQPPASAGSTDSTSSK